MVRYFAKSVSILNVVLAAAIASFFLYALFPLLSAGVSYKPSPGRRAEEPPLAKVQPPQVPSPADYMVVAEDNLFHPERRIPPEKKEEKQLPKPELVLYGTLITEGLSAAYVEDKKAPYTTSGRGKRPRVMKKGDAIDGFVLKEIEPHRITLVRNEEIITVSLDTGKVRGEEGGRGQPQPQTAAQRPASSPAGAPLAPGRSISGSPAVGVPQGSAAPTPATPQMPQRQIRIPARQ